MINYIKPFDEVICDEVRKTYDPTIEVVDGKKVLLYKERTEDPNEGLTYSDFSLQSLIDADATTLLNPISPLSRDIFYVVDTANTVANNISSSIESLNVEPKNEVTNE